MPKRDQLSMFSRQKSSEQQEMERIKSLQKEVAEQRKRNEASYRAAMAGSKNPLQHYLKVNSLNIRLRTPQTMKSIKTIMHDLQYIFNVPHLSSLIQVSHQGRWCYPLQCPRSSASAPMDELNPAVHQQTTPKSRLISMLSSANTPPPL